MVVVVLLLPLTRCRPPLPAAVFLLDGDIDITPVPPFTVVDTQRNILEKYSISGIAYAVSAVWSVTGDTLAEMTPALGGVIGGLGPW